MAARKLWAVMMSVDVVQSQVSVRGDLHQTAESLI